LVREQGLPIRTLLTLHNLSHQGLFPAEIFPLTGLSSGWMTPERMEFHGRVNLLKAGIIAADLLTTVSARYREDILTPQSGCGLEGVLAQRAHELFSAPIGVDPTRWSPSDSGASRLIAAPFSHKNPEGKTLCRKTLLQETGLLPDPRGPVFVMLGRLADQKGFNLLLPLIPRLLSGDTRLIIAGDGDPRLHRDLLLACRRHPGKFAFLHDWDAGFPQRLLAGADVLLMPSHFEPGGLAPLHALAYGTVPVAHATGGLADNSLLYYQDSQPALWDTIVRACLLFEKPALWNKLLHNALRSRYPWEFTAEKLDSLYQRLAR
jgi:starch synthase